MSSFLFFGRKDEIFGILLIIGLFTSSISYLAILFKKGSAKSKLLWTVALIFCIIALNLAVPTFIDISYRIYIKKNITQLSAINDILKDKQGDIEIYHDNIRDKNGDLTILERDELLRRKKAVGTFLISRTDDEIYYGLSGDGDVRMGMLYWTGKTPPGTEYRHLTGGWFR